MAIADVSKNILLLTDVWCKSACTSVIFGRTVVVIEFSPIVQNLRVEILAVKQNV